MSATTVVEVASGLDAAPRAAMLEKPVLRNAAVDAYRGLVMLLMMGEVPPDSQHAL